MGDEPAHTANLRRGAEGEQYVAGQLHRLCGPEVELLFNRRLGVGRRDGDIDIVAVTANGVHIIDVKRYQRASVRVRRRGGLVFPLRERLFIGGRDRTRLLESLDRQQQAVRDRLDQLPDGTSVPLYVAMCFVDADLPLVADRIGGVALLGPRRVARRLNEFGPLGSEARTSMVGYLANHLPPA